MSDWISPSQMKPCCMRPHSMSPQWWQYVGLWKVFLPKLCPCAAGGCSVGPATDAMTPTHRSRQIFTVNLHWAHAYYMSMWSRNRTRTYCGRRVSLHARVTCLWRISWCLPYTADHHWRITCAHPRTIQTRRLLPGRCVEAPFAIGPPIRWKRRSRHLPFINYIIVGAENAARAPEKVDLWIWMLHFSQN